MTETGDRRTGSGSLLRPLREKNFRLLWLGQSVSNIGNGMYSITLAWTVYSVTGSALDMGGVLAANVVPQLIFMIFGGVLADRASRRQVIFLANVADGVITAVLAVAASTHRLGAAALVAASFLLGAASAFFVPAYSSIIPDILAPADVRAGSALRSMTSNAVRLVSPALGGLVYGYGGPGPGFGIDAATFAFAALTVRLMTVPPGKLKIRRTVLGDIADGFRYITATPWLRTLIVTALVANTACVAPMEVLLALIVREAHQKPVFLGAALSVQTAVTILAAAAVGKWGGRFRLGAAFCSLAAILACGVAVIGLSPRPETILIGVVLTGTGFAFGVVEDTALARLVPRDYRGRINGVSGFLAFSLLPVAYALAGAAARHYGAGTALTAGGAASILACAVAFLTLGRGAAVPHDAASTPGADRSLPGLPGPAWR